MTGHAAAKAKEPVRSPGQALYFIHENMLTQMLRMKWATSS